MSAFSDVTIDLAGEKLSLLPERAVFWSARNTLILADLHLGKDDTFRASSMPLPVDVSTTDLDGVTAICARLPVDRVLILGDFVHHRTSLGSLLNRRLNKWRSQVAVSKVQVILGNHDTHAGLDELPAGIELIGDTLHEGPFVFRHHPDPVAGKQVIAGHVHPVVVLEGRGGDKLRLPCFVEENGVFTLPSYGSLTGGYEITRAANRTIYAAAGRTILRLPAVIARSGTG